MASDSVVACVLLLVGVCYISETTQFSWHRDSWNQEVQNSGLTKSKYPGVQEYPKRKRMPFRALPAMVPKDRVMFSPPDKSDLMMSDGGDSWLKAYQKKNVGLSGGITLRSFNSGNAGRTNSEPTDPADRIVYPVALANEALNHNPTLKVVRKSKADSRDPPIASTAEADEIRPKELRSEVPASMVKEMNHQTKTFPKKADPVIVRKAIAPESIDVDCGESLLHLEVNTNFLGKGRQINPSDLSLGDCTPTSLNTTAGTLVFNVELHKCGSVVQVTDRLLVYHFTLSYTPLSSKKLSLMKRDNAVVNISCQYERLQNVSSGSVAPTWVPIQEEKTIKTTFDFSLKLLDDDLKSERVSTKYTLGDVIDVEASVQQFSHAPLEVFVDECVASPNAGIDAEPTYYFVKQHGCLLDSKLPDSESRFLPDTQDGAVRLQLETFKFDGNDQNTLFITCTLRAVLDPKPSNRVQKACFFSKEEDRWINAKGNDEACDCCDNESCSQREARSLGFMKTTMKRLGPVYIED